MNAYDGRADGVSANRNAADGTTTATGVPADRMIGIETDFTACTVLPTTDDGIPVCELDEYRDRPHAYDALYAEYELLHDYFGQGGNDVMKRLKRIRREAVTS